MALVALTRDGRKVVLDTATGPSANVSVASGASADVDIPVGLFELARKDSLIVSGISGLPDGIVLQGFSVPNLDTVRLRVRNVTAATITITANSVSCVLHIVGT
jgi:hypothetical protein